MKSHPGIGGQIDSSKIVPGHSIHYPTSIVTDIHIIYIMFILMLSDLFVTFCKPSTSTIFQDYDWWFVGLLFELLNLVLLHKHLQHSTIKSHWKVTIIDMNNLNVMERERVCVLFWELKAWDIFPTLPRFGRLWKNGYEVNQWWHVTEEIKLRPPPRQHKFGENLSNQFDMYATSIETRKNMG